MSTVILSLLGMLNIVLIAFPNISKLKNLHWKLIKIAIITIVTIWIILLPSEILECYFYIGGSVGLGFLIKGYFTKKMYKYLYLIFSHAAFSLVFLAINQRINFTLNLVFSYILFLGLFFYSLNTKQIDDDKIVDSKGSKVVINILVFSAFSTLFGFLIFSLLKEGQIHLIEISLVRLFRFQSEYLTLLIIIFVAIITAVILMMVDLFTQLKRKDDEQWYI
ncbi:MAG: hypothetical protein KGD64_11245 [Candidatus Heimdallarchaeota archaeon]|nr:hypothetical protein [Candidatus Heimdallarchaeota archaeon]